jgi:hypothetical protein
MPVGANAFASIQVSTESYPSSLPAIPGFDLAVNGSDFQNVTGLIFK